MYNMCHCVECKVQDTWVGAAGLGACGTKCYVLFALFETICNRPDIRLDIACTHFPALSKLFTCSRRSHISSAHLLAFLCPYRKVIFLEPGRVPGWPSSGIWYEGTFGEHVGEAVYGTVAATAWETPRAANFRYHSLATTDMKSPT